MDSLLEKCGKGYRHVVLWV